MSHLDRSACTASPWRWAQRLASPWRTSLTFTFVAVGVSIMLTGIVAVLQDRIQSWHPIGHSIILWVALSLLTATRGTFRQAVVSTQCLLVCSVVAYYATTTAVSPFEEGDSILFLMVFWVVGAIAGGFIFSTVALVAFSEGRIGGLAVGLVAGIIFGDVSNASSGIPFLDNSAFVGMLETLLLVTPLTVIGGCALVVYLSVMTVHRAKSGLSVLLIPLGVPLGFVLVSLPDIVLHGGR
jgi:hypothetical protein